MARSLFRLVEVWLVLNDSFVRVDLYASFLHFSVSKAGEYCDKPVLDVLHSPAVYRPRWNVVNKGEAVTVRHAENGTYRVGSNNIAVNGLSSVSALETVVETNAWLVVFVGT